MRLITHNMLVCNKKGVENGYPLRITAEETEDIACDFQPDFIRKILPKLDWSAFIGGAKDLQVATDLPNELPTDASDQVLRSIHHVLLEVHVKKGKLTCPESGREFPIVDSIPNMLLREDEVGE